MSAEEDELEGLDAETARKVRFVAEYCVVADANGTFKGLPEWAKADYLHDARNAVQAIAEYDAARIRAHRAG